VGSVASFGGQGFIIRLISLFVGLRWAGRGVANGPVVGSTCQTGALSEVCLFDAAPMVVTSAHDALSPHGAENVDSERYKFVGSGRVH
jgi:hypothetical protein